MEDPILPAQSLECRMRGGNKRGDNSCDAGLGRDRLLERR